MQVVTYLRPCRGIEFRKSKRGKKGMGTRGRSLARTPLQTVQFLALESNMGFSVLEFRPRLSGISDDISYLRDGISTSLPIPLLSAVSFTPKSTQFIEALKIDSSPG